MDSLSIKEYSLTRIEDNNFLIKFLKEKIQMKKNNLHKLQNNIRRLENQSFVRV